MLSLLLIIIIFYIFCCYAKFEAVTLCVSRFAFDSFYYDRSLNNNKEEKIIILYYPILIFRNKDVAVWFHLFCNIMPCNIFIACFLSNLMNFICFDIFLIYFFLSSWMTYFLMLVKSSLNDNQLSWQIGVGK